MTRLDVSSYRNSPYKKEKVVKSDGCYTYYPPNSGDIGNHETIQKAIDMAVDMPGNYFLGLGDAYDRIFGGSK